MNKNTLTDEELINIYQSNRSTLAFSIIYQRHNRSIYKKCLLIIGSKEDAQDITQDVFLKVFENPNTFHHRSTLSTWIHSIAYNKCIDLVRQKRATKVKNVCDSLIDQLIKEGNDVTDTYSLKLNLLKRISEKDLMLLRMKHELGLTVKELSQQYEIKECAIKMRLKRSRDYLRVLYTVNKQSLDT